MSYKAMEKVINGVLTREDEVTNELDKKVTENISESQRTNADMVTEATAKPEVKTPYAGTRNSDFINLSLVAYEANKRNQSSPDYRIFTKKENVNAYGKKSNWLSTGAIWKKSGKNGEFLSITLTRDVLVDLLKQV